MPSLQGRKPQSNLLKPKRTGSRVVVIRNGQLLDLPHEKRTYDDRAATLPPKG